ncbi:hypothetical protein EGW08_022815 [Elysia chlorotica]|uniref:Uncharacterized protein n=1 Tax=Elysia chlorotica TaxID=188477 RepID=A0A3S1BKN9_ELYCH|nr:hypothetical protein EGW08_022815 [Elysia chlorotica]
MRTMFALRKESHRPTTFFALTVCIHVIAFCMTAVGIFTPQWTEITEQTGLETEDIVYEMGLVVSCAVDSGACRANENMSKKSAVPVHVPITLTLPRVPGHARDQRELQQTEGPTLPSTQTCLLLIQSSTFYQRGSRGYCDAPKLQEGYKTHSRFHNRRRRHETVRGARLSNLWLRHPIKCLPGSGGRAFRHQREDGLSGEGVVYAVICMRDDHTFIGHSTDRLESTFAMHIANVKAMNLSDPVAHHFTHADHKIRDIRVTALAKIDTDLETRERLEKSLHYDMDRPHNSYFGIDSNFTFL